MIGSLRLALRHLGKSPSFAAVAVLTLALGIGSATTLFSVIHNVLIDPFPYADADRVVALHLRDLSERRDRGRTFFSSEEFLAYRDESQVFEDVIAGTYDEVLYRTGEGTEPLNGGRVSLNTFSFLGVPALHGRTFTDADGAPGAPPVFVISYRMWARHFGLDPSVIGRTFVLNDVPTTLIGIMPSRFAKMAADVYLPFDVTSPEAQSPNRASMFQARLKPEVTVAEAEARLQVVGQRLSAKLRDRYPASFRLVLVPWAESVVGGFRRVLFILAAAVGLLLLIACANVANLLLARSAARRKEMAVRAALGAGRATLVRQLLVESLLLALAGAALGSLFAHAGLQALVALIPTGTIPREAVIHVNLPALAFSLGVAALTTIVFGLAPALETASHDLTGSLKDGQKGGSGGGRLRHGLVVAQVALALVLMTGAGLLLRTVIALQTADLGFRPEGLVVTSLAMPAGVHDSAAEQQVYFDGLLTRLRVQAGIESVGVGTGVPFFGGRFTPVEVTGEASSESRRAMFELCDPGYFATLGVRTVSGRTFSADEIAGARRVTVVNETFAKRFFGAGSPLGRGVRLQRFEELPEHTSGPATFEIVGVVSDSRNQGLDGPIQPQAYMPYSVTGVFRRMLIARAAGATAPLLASLPRHVWAVDRRVALGGLTTLEDILGENAYARPRFSMVVLSVFAAVGLVLVTIGVYGVLAYMVSLRTHEIGVRMALGAGRGHVLSVVVSQGLRLVGLGVAIGGLGALVLTGVLEEELASVTARDPVTFASAIALVFVAGFLACFIPARRALGVDPIVALRWE